MEIWILIDESNCRLVGAYLKRDDAIKASSEYVNLMEKNSDASQEEISVRMELLNVR